MLGYNFHFNYLVVHRTLISCLCAMLPIKYGASPEKGEITIAGSGLVSSRVVHTNMISVSTFPSLDANFIHLCDCDENRRPSSCGRRAIRCDLEYILAVSCRGHVSQPFNQTWSTCGGVSRELFGNLYSHEGTKNGNWYSPPAPKSRANISHGIVSSTLLQEV